jgi:hypothetical protein
VTGLSIGLAYNVPESDYTLYHNVQRQPEGKEISDLFVVSILPETVGGSRTLSMKRPQARYTAPSLISSEIEMK